MVRALAHHAEPGGVASELLQHQSAHMNEQVRRVLAAGVWINAQSAFIHLKGSRGLAQDVAGERHAEVGEQGGVVVLRRSEVRVASFQRRVLIIAIGVFIREDSGPDPGIVHRVQRFSKEFQGRRDLVAVVKCHVPRVASPCGRCLPVHAHRCQPRKPRQSATHFLGRGGRIQLGGSLVLVTQHEVAHHSGPAC